MMEFKKIDKPIGTDDIYYDLFDGGYIDPHELLTDDYEANLVEEAINRVKTFLREAQEAGVLEAY